MKIVEKWVAGFWGGGLIVVKWKFRETPKTFVMVKEDCKEYRDAQTATSYKSSFHKSGKDQIFDTWEDALDNLHALEMSVMKGYRNGIDRSQLKLNQIDDFDLTSE